MSAMRGVSLVITRRVVKADYGWTFAVPTITNSLLSNIVVTGVAITSVKKITIPPIIILFIPIDPLFN